MEVERESWDGSMARAMELGKAHKKDQDISQRPTLTEPAWGTALKERNPWNTPTESCESDETEVGEVMQFRAPPGQPDQRSQSRGSDARVDRRNKDPRVEVWVPDRRNLEGGESSAPKIQTNEGRKPV